MPRRLRRPPGRPSRRRPLRRPSPATAARRCPPPTDHRFLFENVTAPARSPSRGRIRSGARIGLVTSELAADDAPFPSELTAPGTADAPWAPLLDVAELPPGAMRRVTRGDLDVLLAHTTDGIVAVADRCPHMSAPLSIGTLEGCVVACPLHEGRFDLRSGDVVQMPTTGGLDADGHYHATWSQAGREADGDHT